MGDHQKRQFARVSLARTREALAPLRGLLLRLLRDVSVWSDVRAFPPLAVLAGLDCVACLVLRHERTGSTPLRPTDLRLCVAAFAAAMLTISSRWLLMRVEREAP